MTGRDLPITEIKDTLLAALAKQRRVILTAPTGSGKSTQVPQMLLDGGVLDGVVAAVPAASCAASRPRRTPLHLHDTYRFSIPKIASNRAKSSLP